MLLPCPWWRLDETIDDSLMVPWLESDVVARVVPAALDRGYDSGVTRRLLAGLAITGAIARKGLPAPLQVGKWWVVERTQSWINGFGKVRSFTERTGQVVDVSLFLAATFVVTRCLIREARRRYRWPTRPTTRRLTCCLWPLAPNSDRE